MRIAIRVLLAVLFLETLVVGGWNALAPESFYRLVPTVDLTPPFSEHYATDFGWTQLGICLLLGLYDKDGLLHHVGYTSAFSDVDRDALRARLDRLKGGPGFTGRAPGGPSRWSTERSGAYVKLAHEIVAEVRYDHVTGDRFRHGTSLMRWRPDKAPRQCTFAQLGREARPARLIRDLMETP